MAEYYKKKPIIVEAVQYNGIQSIEEVRALSDNFYIKDNALFIKTLEGDMRCNIGSYVVKGIGGEIYPVYKEIFEKTYERC